MTDSKQLQQQMRRIGDLVQEIERIADPSLRATARELVQSLMDLHGAGLEKIMEIVYAAGEPGMNIIDAAGRDPLAGSLLVLYGLHPETLETRVLRALERIRPKLLYQGGELEILGVQESEVRLRLNLKEHTCGSTGGTLRSIVEEALAEAAPDITALVIEGTEGKAASGFVSMEQLMGGQSPAMLVSLPTRAGGPGTD